MAKRARKNLARNIPLSIDADLLATVDRLAGDRNETRSLIMRKAIEEGLPLVKAGGNADVLTLDSELSADVTGVSKELKVTRNKIILEAIQAGLQSVYWRLTREKIVNAQDQNPAEAASMAANIQLSERMDDPMSRQVRAALIERGQVQIRLMDILQHVPEAKRREDLVNRLIELRKKPGGIQYTKIWGNGLSNQEIEWEIKMSEKYGSDSSKWPKDECEARDAARAVEFAERQAARQLESQKESTATNLPH